MHEIARVTLENEMDFILAHRSSMKLAELAGLSLAAQTTFATAVSEVSRSTLEGGKNCCLYLGVHTQQRKKYIVASLKSEQYDAGMIKEGLTYAKRLVHHCTVAESGSSINVELFYQVYPSFDFDLLKLDEWRKLFRNQPPVSPYEELKRKNEQLNELAEKLQKSEGQYRILTNSLPMIIFSIDAGGRLLYANEWLKRFTGESIDHLNKKGWQTVLHPDDFEKFSDWLSKEALKRTAAIQLQARLKNKQSGEYLWHQVSLSPFKNDTDETDYWIGYMVDIHAQKVFEETLKDNIELKQAQEKLKENQQTLEKFIEELNRSNHELQQFAYVASHDLQEPVRKILFYSDYLLSIYGQSIDGKGLKYLSGIQTASQRMRTLIQDLLVFSQINKEIKLKEVDLNKVAADACQDLEMAIEEKKAILNIDSFPPVKGDERMMRQLFENLISNALKYSKPSVQPVLDITCRQKDDMVEIAFRDNGIGFDQQYVHQVFDLFQRLHNKDIYEGTGLGLAICKKIVDIHQGQIWAEGKEQKGATFYISLPLVSPHH